MGVKDEFMGASLLIKIAFFVGLAANFCNWLSFTTSSWMIADNPGAPDRHTGLWRSCSDQIATCSNVDGTAHTSFGATQAFAIFGFVGVNVAFLLIILFMFYGSCKQNSEAGMASGIIFIVAGVMWLVAVIIFGADIYEDLPGLDLGYSFIFGCITLIVAVVAGVLMILGTKGGGSVGSK